MAKGTPKTPSAPKMAKAKTPAQKAKAEANIQAAAERLRKLQEKQALAKQLRGQGYVGSDDAVIKAYADKQAAEYDAARNAEHVRFNEIVLRQTGKVGQKIGRWLASRITREPEFVREKIVYFLTLERNAEDAAYVNKVLEHLGHAPVVPPATTQEAA